MRRFSKRAQGRESGQATIFIAVMMAALMGTVGLAVEGGRVFVEYRQIQSAADMAALVGAQGLPCTTSNTSCITASETLGCQYATANGYTGCSAGGGSAPSANVPPVTCTPYNFVPYGNTCDASTPSYYDYIEVRLTKNLGTIPIFGTQVTLSAHAVAKHGPITGSDYALITLDPNQPLEMGGSSVVKIDGSVFTNGGIQGNGDASSTCAGGWFSAGTISNVTTDLNGTPSYAPPSCTGSNDSNPDDQSHLSQIGDPYAGGSPPPTQPQGTTFANCPECSQPGQWYDLDKGSWGAAGGDPGATNDNVELFPGIYSQIALANTATAYFNPGVYTFTSGYDLNHGNMCVYGAPDCGDANCVSTTFANGSAAGDQYYYSCSPYGLWDSTLAATNSALSTVPTFWDSSTGTTSSVPLNGVTMYIPNPNTGVTIHGNGGKNGNVYLAAPNPCTGTGTYSTGPPAAVTFPAGAQSGVFSYDSTYTGVNNTYSSGNLPHGITSTPLYTSPSPGIFPSMDFSLTGECGSALEDWQNEFQHPQHLHFLWYITGPNTGKINGTSGDKLTGIWYAPNDNETWQGNTNSSTPPGPPWLDGQLILKDGTFTGNTTNGIEYRPCGGDFAGCGSGTGTQLIQ